MMVWRSVLDLSLRTVDQECRQQGHRTSGCTLGGTALPGRAGDIEMRPGVLFRIALEETGGRDAAADAAIMFFRDYSDKDKAQSYAKLSQNDTLIHHLSLADTAINTLSEDDCLELMPWYLALSHDAEAVDSKVVVLRAAISVHERFLKLHPKRNGPWLEADLRLKALLADLARFQPDSLKLMTAILPLDLANDLLFAASFDSGTVANANGVMLIRDLSRPSSRVTAVNCVIRPSDIGDGIQFIDGKGSHIDLSKLPVAVQGNGARTISLWMLTRTGGAMVSTGSPQQSASFDFVDRFGGVGLLGVMGFGNDMFPITGIRVDDRRWHFVATSFDGRILKTFVDGRMDNSKAMRFQTNGQQNFIGMIPQEGHPEWYSGHLDEVAIWNKCLSARDIARLYAFSKSGQSYCDALSFDGNQKVAH